MNRVLNELHPTIVAYVEATNHHDPAAFLDCFEEDAVVNDVGRMWRGREAIRGWSEREVFVPRVELEVLAASVQGDETLVTTRVEGNFDRTGLPDPVVIEQRVVLENDRISRLTCQFARGRG